MHEAAIRLVLAVVFLAFSAVPALAQTATTPPAGLPPLIDRELFLGDPEIGNARISPDGRFIAFLTLERHQERLGQEEQGSLRGSGAHHRRTEAPDPARLLEPRRPLHPLRAGSRRRRDFHVHAVNPAEPPPAGADVPPARNLTNATGARAVIYATPWSDPDVIYVGLNDRDRLWHGVYRIRISTRERTLLRRNTDRISTSPTSGGASWVFDREGRLRLATRIASDGGTEFLRVDGQGLVKVLSCSAFETCAPIAFIRPADERVGAVSWPLAQEVTCGSFFTSWRAWAVRRCPCLPIPTTPACRR
jgi:hypothetical protein